MIDPKQGPFPTPPRRGRNVAAWIEYQVDVVPWRAIDDAQRPGGRPIDGPAIDGPARQIPTAIDDPAPPEPPDGATHRRWVPEQPPRDADSEPPNHRPGPTDHRPH